MDQFDYTLLSMLSQMCLEKYYIKESPSGRMNFPLLCVLVMSNVIPNPI